MGRRHYISQPIIKTWTLLRFDLSDDESGFLLDHGGLLADAGCVHAFRTREAALAFAKEREPTLEAIPNGRFFDLRAVEAFVDRRSSEFPSAALDIWSVLNEVARAAGRDVPALRHASLPTVTGTGASLLEPLRVALAAGLDVFRDVVSYVEAMPPLLAVRARRVTTPMVDR